MQPDLVVSGVGIVSAIGHGKSAFAEALMRGDANFAPMQRSGRVGASTYIGAEMPDFQVSGAISKQTQRAASLTAQAALAVLDEAWHEARLSQVDPKRIGLIVGGSNVQQRELSLLTDLYRGREGYIRPTYALSFMDTDICGFCTAQFEIHGTAHTVGGASASGQLAIMQAAQLVASGQVDVCIALGALMDLSHWECQALRSIGAMGSDRYADEPMLACRPFDHNHDGFIYGECSGALVIERNESCKRRNVRPYAALSGWGMTVDGNRNPDPSLEGEVRAIELTLKSAGLRAHDIDYVNPHGTGSIVGDGIEVRALRECGMENAWVNATKSLIGHGLSAAGAVEAIATLIQMEAGCLHPTRNLESPIDSSLNWVRSAAVNHHIQNAVTLSMGFGGINTAVCWKRLTC